MKLTIMMNSKARIQDLEDSVVQALAHRFGLSVCTEIPQATEPTRHFPTAMSIDRPSTPERAAGIVDAALGDVRLVTAALEGVRLVTPPPTPERPVAAATTKPEEARAAAKPTNPSHGRGRRSARRVSCALPSPRDPADDSFRASLYSKKDKGRINPVHHALFRDVLDVRRTVSGRVYFQCRHCDHLHTNDRANMSTIAPQSLKAMYRAVGRFIRYHVQACEHIPEHIKAEKPKDARMKNDKGTKAYWIRSAERQGLKNGSDGSIVYCKPAEY